MPSDSLAKARTPEPTGHGGHNWLTRLKPGNSGEQPAYIQHIVHALMTKRGMPQAEAEAIAVSAPKRWLKSRHADAGTKAASALAVGQWEKDRAQSRVGRAARAVATHAAEVPVRVSDITAICETETGIVEAIEEVLGQPVLEAALARVQWADYVPVSPREHVLDELAERAAEALTLIEATRSTREVGTGKFTNYLKRVTTGAGATNCGKCGALRLPDKLCPSCEAPLAGHKVASLAEAAVLVVQERKILQGERESLLAKGQAIKNADGSISYPIRSPADLKPAAVLAKSKHGNYKAGGALVSKMAKKWGVKDPMQESSRPSLGDLQKMDRDMSTLKRGEHIGVPHPERPKTQLARGTITKVLPSHILVKTANHGELKVHHKDIRERHGRLLREDSLNEADEWAHLPAHKRPNATALEAARRISPNKGKPDMVARDRKAFGKALTGGKLTSDEHASARAHAIRTNQVHALRKARAGKLTEAERQWLMEAEIDRAKPTPHSGMLARVKALNLGETARMPDGLAVTHAATPDGRKVWRADTPSRYSSSGWSLGDDKRTPEDAVKDAFVNSAASNDPASLGGATRYHTYSRVKVSGNAHRFVGVDPNSAKPQVRDIAGVGQPDSIKTVGWDELHPVDDIMQQSSPMDSMLDARLEERARARRDTIGAIAGKGGPADTMAFHTSGGKFSKGRAQVHGQMIRHVLDNPKAHNSGDVTMVATRSPAGGAVQTVKSAGAAVPHDAVHVSIPAMRENLPEHAALKAHASADEHKTTDREARHVAKLASTMALMRGKSVVVHDDKKAPA